MNVLPAFCGNFRSHHEVCEAQRYSIVRIQNVFIKVLDLITRKDCIFKILKGVFVKLQIISSK